MTLRTLLNDAVAAVGLDVCAILPLTVLLTGVLEFCRRLGRPPNRLIKLSACLPGLLAVALTAAGIAECWLMISLLGEQAAISPSQTRLMVSSAAWNAARRLAIGAVATCWLYCLVRRLPKPDGPGR